MVNGQRKKKKSWTKRIALLHSSRAGDALSASEKRAVEPEAKIGPRGDGGK